MRSKPKKGLRWRVSVYPPGVTDNLPKDYPLKHHACYAQATAQAHFDSYAEQIGQGKIGRVIMHQGKLYRGESQYIHMDTKWLPTKYGGQQQTDVPLFRCTACGQVGTVGRCCGRDTQEHVNDSKTSCRDCGANSGVTGIPMWCAGGARMGDYNEWESVVPLCKMCESKYTVCEKCGVLIGDEVSIPGSEIICPGCRDKSTPSIMLGT